MIDRSVMQKSIPVPSGFILGLGAAVFTAILFKIGLLVFNAVPFNADEAIVALMARHILQGERPLFFYGQAYMGSLDAVLVAGVFKLLGYEILAIRIVQVALYAATLWTTGWLGKLLSGKWQVGVLAAWILAIPPVNMTLYTTASLGGYGEMLLIGNLILILTVSIVREEKSPASSSNLYKMFGLGFLSGFGLWVFGLTLVYSLPAVLFLAWHTWKNRDTSGFSAGSDYEAAAGSRAGAESGNQSNFVFRSWVSLCIGVLLGALPWIWYALQYGMADLFVELGGGAISGVESMSWARQLLQHILNLGLFGSTAIFGLRPSWEIRWLGVPLAPLVLAFWVAVIIYAVRKTVTEMRNKPESHSNSFAPLVSGVIICLMGGFLISPFGADPSGRYFLPVTVVLALYAAQAIWDWRSRSKYLVEISIGIVLLFNFWGTVQSVLYSPARMTTQFDAVTQIDHSYDPQLIEFLTAQGEYFGYTNYWVAYPLAFRSGESLVYIPGLPYHPDLRYTSRDNRYEPYTQLVDSADRAAYITTRNPRLDETIRSGFRNLGVTWNEETIGDYQVYYQLSEKVSPTQIGIGGGEG